MSTPAAEGFRLSPLQLRQWELRAQGQPSQALFTFGLRGPVVIPDLAAALQQLVEQHEILRTGFVQTAAMATPLQVIQATRPTDLQLHDLRQCSETEQAQALSRIEQALLGDSAPGAADGALAPLALALVCLAPDEHLGLLKLPALAADLATGSLLLRDLCRAYDGVRSPAAESRLQYADISEWLNELQAEAATGMTDDAAFWRRLDCAGLATERLAFERATAAPAQLGEQRLCLPAELRDRLDATAAQLGAPGELFLLACWQVLLWRLAAQAQVVIGVAHSARELAELLAAPGPLTCYLPHPAELTAELTFAQLLAQSRQRHQDLAERQRSFSWSLLTSAPGKDRCPFLFDYHELASTESSRGLKLWVVAQQAHFEPCRLRLAVERSGDAVTLTFYYDRSHLTAAAVELLADQLQTLLADASQRPHATLTALRLSSERSGALLRDWEAGPQSPESPLLVHERFAQQARQTPAAVAVTVLPSGERLTYGELDARADRLARVLGSLGVGPECRVGVCLPRGVELPVALLGVLKAGGAYVPIDPTLPQARIDFMVADAQPAVLITLKGLGAAIFGQYCEGSGGPRVLCLDGDWEAPAGSAAGGGLQGAGPHNLAYCIYTSGSTGAPKGTLIEHRGLTNYLTWALQAYEVAAGSGAPVNTSISFDATITSLFCPLLVGGQLTLLPEQGELEALARLLQSGERFSLVKLTPSHLQVLAGLVDRPIAARCLVIGGEALRESHLTFLRTYAPAARLINEYGPTETVVGCCVYDASAAAGEGPIPIGRPIANTRLRVLDAHGAAVPIGAAGELYIGGAGVARGYHQRPELTAARFGSFAQDGQRLYRTGDRVRWLADGQLEFLGRSDDQIKLRGHRIELGEIEAVLRQHPAVRESLVLLHEEPAGQRSLTGYVTLAAPSGTAGATGAASSGLVTPSVTPTVTADELRAFVAARLPEPMVPASLVILAAFPLNSSGKLDRQKLAATRLAAAGSRYAPPQTATEELLVEIWADVLKRDRIGIHDRFFELGGDSLLSVQVLARARAAGLSFELQQLFKLQTVHALAQAARPSEPEPEPPPPLSLVAESDRSLLPADIEDAYPLAAVQLAMLFFSQYNAGSHVYHNISRFRLQAPFSAPAWEEVLRSALARHPILRTSFHVQGFGTPLQLVHREVAPLLWTIDLRHLPAAEQRAEYARFVAAERASLSAWDKAPLVRVHLHRLADEVCELTLSLHHALLDGWSLASLVTELLTDYECRLRGVLPARPRLATTFRDFVALEQAAVHSQPAREYWRRTLEGATAQNLPRWPVAYRDGAADGAADSAALINVQVPSEVAHKLRELARLAAAPIKSVLLAAHLRVLSWLGNQQDVLTGFTSHGRPEQLGAEQVLGNYLNVLPLRLQLEGGTWLELVKQVLEVELAALPFRRYPLANIQRELGGRPLFETALNFSHFHVADEVERLPGLRVLAMDELAAGEMTLQVNVTLNGQKGGLALQLTYNPAELGRTQVEKIAGYYGRTLAAMAQAPTARYETFSPLSEAERELMLHKWNDRPLEYPPDILIHHLIEAQAARRPEAVALVAYEEATPIRDRAARALLPAGLSPGPVTLTYGALDRRANQLAHCLRSLGVGPGALVAICLERSVELGVSMLGVLKAGAGYVPLDPAYPEDRLGYMLENAEARVVITSGALDQRLPVLAGAPAGRRAVVLLDAGAAVWQRPETPVPRADAPANLAYCIYTSGSTGRPKGVLVTHRNWLNSFRMWEQTYRLEQSHCHLQMASFSFDVFPADFARALCSGATLVHCPREWLLDGERLLALLRAEQVDCAEFIPAVLRHFAQYLRDTGQKLTSLNWVVTGGDTWYLDEYWRWREVLGPDTRLLNTYGMTEVTIDSSYFETDDPVRFGGNTITPIGHPFGNVRHYILDRWQQPVPIGTCGEIYIGGRGVSLGYINRPELTAERFLENPFVPGERLCRSGDLGRYLPDGTAEFVGRQDTQVKLRGFRVEIGEIESLLSQHPGVRQAAILVDEERPGSARLVAYVAWRAADSGAAADAPTESAASPQQAALVLRQYLAAKLPEYMVPAVIMVLAKLPLTANGKLDRRALPRPESAAGVRTVTAPPRTPTEEVLAGIWRQLLGLEQLGTGDHFADLGGHSLVAMQLAARVRAAFQLELSLRTILDHPTVASLAQHLDELALAARLQTQLTDPGEGAVDLLL